MEGLLGAVEKLSQAGKGYYISLGIRGLGFRGFILSP